MGQHELLAALHREGEELASSLRSKAEAESEAIRADAARRLDELQVAYEERRGKLCSDRRRDILARAERDSAIVRLKAEHELARRLRERADTLLRRLRDNNGDVLFTLLAAELPGIAWDRVRVGPGDAALAKKLFPAAAIESDSSIVGGLEAVSADGCLTVVNTLEVRLERIWPELLPRMVSELREGLS